MESIDGNVLRGHLETLILAQLDRGPAHGFEIMKRLDEEGGGALALKEGTVYPILYRLEKEKCVRAAWDKATAKSGGPRRRVYHITARGKRELASRRDAWTRFITTVGRMIEASP